MTCRRCGKTLRFAQEKYCSNRCSTLANASGNVVVCDPDHGHRWQVHFRGGDTFWVWYWSCGRCGSYVAQGADAERFVEPCESRREEAA